MSLQAISVFLESWVNVSLYISQRVVLWSLHCTFLRAMTDYKSTALYTGLLDCTSTQPKAALTVLGLPGGDYLKSITSWLRDWYIIKSQIYFDEPFQEGDLKWNSCQGNYTFGSPARKLWGKLSLWRLPHRRQYVRNDLKSRISGFYAITTCLHSTWPSQKWKPFERDGNFRLTQRDFPCLFSRFHLLLKSFLHRSATPALKGDAPQSFFPDATFSK